MFGIILTYVLAFLCIAVVGGYAYMLSVFSYWRNRNVKSIKPSFPFGNFAESFLGRVSLPDQCTELYRKTSEPFLGVYSLNKPIVLLRDTDLIKQILIKDFSTFVDRGIYSDSERDPISAHLFALAGDKWRSVRTKLSPTFSTGKLKMMFPAFIECSGRLEKFVEQQVENRQPIDARELMARFSTDIIASVGFGIDIDCINNPNVEFRDMGRQFFAPTIKNGLRFFITFALPKLAHLIKMRTTDKHIEKFMYDLVESNMKYREENNVVRKDFFQQLLQLRNTGKIGMDDNWDGSFTESKIKNLTLGEMVAHTFVFYLAGFETTSTTMSFCLFELCKSARIQQKVQDEINEVLERHDGKVTFESINDMTYLDMCVDETLRMYPPVPILNRESNKDYTIPGTDVTLEPKTAVIIPTYALHHDEKYFPKPEEFIPERFTNPKDMADKPYYPFGDGPRICIGMRMGKMQAKVGLAMMLKNTTFRLDPKTPRTLKFDPRNVVLGPVERPIFHGIKRGTKVSTDMFSLRK